MSRAEEKRKTRRAWMFPRRTAKPLDDPHPGLRADLADLKELLRQLEVSLEATLAERMAYDSQNTAHGQFLVMSKLRIEDLENAVQDNRLVSRSLSEEVERVTKKRGLILLFERSIQAGEYVEGSGLWVEIKNINVRATAVKNIPFLSRGTCARDPLPARSCFVFSPIDYGKSTPAASGGSADMGEIT